MFTPHIKEKFSEDPLRATSCAILKALSLIHPISATVRTNHNFEINCVFPDSISSIIYLNREYEPELTRKVLENVKPGQTFIDVGAHIGYFSLLASVMVGETGQVHSFEPSREIFEILKENQAENMTVKNLALSSKYGGVELQDFGLRFSAYNNIKELPSRIPKETYSVGAVKLDDYVSFSGIEPDFIKIDAEGSEFDILQGAALTIDRFHPIITLETRSGEEDGDSARFLREKGYVPSDEEIPKGQYGNVLWRHKT
jgi:FkbM family methyltransferase